MTSDRPLRARIDGAAFEHNLGVARKFAPASKIMAVVKADAYGHGLADVLPSFSSADGFAVVGVDAAMQCRAAFPDKPVVLLEGAFEADELPLMAEYALTPVIHSEWQLDMLEATGASPIPQVFLKFNTGMNRLGFDPEAGAEVYRRLTALPGVQRISLMSHLACADDTADDFTVGQINRFEAATSTLPGEKSLANSAGVVAWPASHYDWVRPGIMLYGGSPLLHKNAVELDLKPAMTLESRLIAVQKLKKGDAVGYGQTWTCPEDMSVGVVACGYGDGYPRHALSGTPVLVNGRRAQVVGRVSMDTLAVDLRGAEADVGAKVVLWGEGLPADDVASAAGTIAYELFTGVTKRVPRFYG